MELRQLEYLVAVAEEANFTRAAERVRISQSGVSAQIRQLEHDLGAPLIDRSGRTATLTQAGKAAVSYANQMLAAAAALRQSVAEVTGLLSGRLTVGMVTACTVTPLFDALAAFHDDHPGVAVTLLEDNSATLTQHVRSGALDIALIGAAGSPPPALAALPVISERLVAAAQKTHFLSERSRLTLTDLAGCPLICLPAGTGIRTVFDQAVSAAGVRLDVALEASAPAAVADLAARGLGVAILSETIAAAHADRLHAAVLDDVVTPALLALIWRPSPSPAAAAFLTHCRRAFALP
ncbi:MAG TPA: LysR substrate-binding domain-containing protein [Trebonia sp.]|nr:LysR substrate-binding domain-containing protein [Trebonia sp.]